MLGRERRLAFMVGWPGLDGMFGGTSPSRLVRSYHVKIGADFSE